MTTSIKSDMGCINCNFTTTDEIELRFHPCKQGANRSDFAIYRAQVKEAKAEAKRDKAEAEIESITGILEIGQFHTLRHLFAEWESADSELGEATEKVIRLTND